MDPVEKLIWLSVALLASFIVVIVGALVALS